MAAKRMKDRSPIDLRVTMGSPDRELAAKARAELHRRVRNLRGAVIPEWEKARRGPKPEEWAI